MCWPAGLRVGVFNAKKTSVSRGTRAPSASSLRLHAELDSRLRRANEQAAVRRLCAEVEMTEALWSHGVTEDMLRLCAERVSRNIRRSLSAGREHFAASKRSSRFLKSV